MASSYSDLGIELMAPQVHTLFNLKQHQDQVLLLVYQKKLQNYYTQTELILLTQDLVAEVI